MDCFRYIEGLKKPTYYIDYQNCLYHTLNEEDENYLINHKKYWIIIKEKNKWIISDSSNIEDIDKEWNFKTNKPK